MDLGNLLMTLVDPGSQLILNMILIKDSNTLKIKVSLDKTFLNIQVTLIRTKDTSSLSLQTIHINLSLEISSSIVALTIFHQNKKTIFLQLRTLQTFQTLPATQQPRSSILQCSSRLIHVTMIVLLAMTMVVKILNLAFTVFLAFLIHVNQASPVNQLKVSLKYVQGVPKKNIRWNTK